MGEDGGGGGDGGGSGGGSGTMETLHLEERNNNRPSVSRLSSVPHVVQRPTTMTQQTRTATVGAPSVLSTASRPTAVAHHQRKVSFPSSIGGGGTSNNNSPKGRRPAAVGSPPSLSSASPSTRLLNLQDVLASGHHELEAETNILRAVEKITGQQQQQQQQQHSRGHSRGESLAQAQTHDLFRTIAQEEITKSMLLLPDPNDDNDIVVTTNNNNNNNNDPVKSPPTIIRGSDNTTPVVQATVSSSATTNATSNTNTAKYQDLIHTTTKAQATTGNATVEATLFGLANVLNELGDHNSSPSGKARQQSMMGEAFETALPAVDKLAVTVEEHIRGNANTNDSGNTDTGSDTGTEDQSTRDNTISNDNSNNDNNDSNHQSNKKNSKNKKKHSKHKKKKRKGFVSAASSGLKEDLELFSEFVGGKKHSAQSYAKKAILFVMAPAMVLAGLLFYFVEDPKTDDQGNVLPGQNATASWWILFLGCRLVITFSMALLTQALMIDYLALGSRFSLQWFGPIVTLLVVQSKGWPFCFIWWGTFNLVLLQGSEAYVTHWLYWQDWIGLFNQDNPGNHVLDNATYTSFLRFMIIAGVACALKRLVVGLMLGRQTFAHYGKDLAVVMKNMVLLGAVATLAREIEKDKDYYAARSNATTTNPHAHQRDEQEQATFSPSSSTYSVVSGGRGRTLTDEWVPDEISKFVTKEADAAMREDEEDKKRMSYKPPTAPEAAKAFFASQIQQRQENASAALASIPSMGSSHDNDDDHDIPADANAGNQDFTASEQLAISKLLDEWEEPGRNDESEEKKITLGAIMQFRQALSFMKRKYPFLPAFGPADTRERCIQSAQAVYDRLLLRTPHLDELPFETLAVLAKDVNGGINQEKAKELIKAFRPERDGTLGKLEFVKSVDVIYKRLRLLSANITNSSQIDKAIESLFNFVFYLLLICFLLSAMGGDPMAIYLSLSSAILGFSFIFGSTSAKYFEGVLFILVQRPYGVGDRIHLSPPAAETNPNGSPGWIVEKVDLTTTTVCWGTTNERATLNNGAISNLRVINAARSPNATIFVELKFAINTPYEKIAIFRAAVEQFLKERPREWLTMVGFRPTEVAVDRGFLGYKIIAQHRNHWQQIGSILNSKADLTTYCMEVARQLEMKYVSPPLPVDLSLKGSASSALQAMQTDGGVGGTSGAPRRDPEDESDAGGG